MPFPSTACLVQQKIGADRAAAFDIQAACSGFIFGLEIGQQFIMSRTYDTVLVIGAEKLSSIINWNDRNTCVLFGDGAGAAILRNRPNAHGLLTACMGSDGGRAGCCACPAAAQPLPAQRTNPSPPACIICAWTARKPSRTPSPPCTPPPQEVLRRCELDITQIKCIIPHQANRRIIDAVGERLGARPEQVFVNLDKYGNTSAASVAIALDEAVETKRIQRGDLVLLIVFGAGLTWGAAVIEW